MMKTNGHEFGQRMKKAEEYFGKDLSKAQAEMYHDACGHIPLFPLEDILKNIIRSRRPTPGNMPTPDEINAGYRQWQSANPKKIIVEYEPCDECHGTGFIWFKKDDYQTGYQYEHVARCALCRNWRQEIHENVLPAFTKKQLEDLGYEVFNRVTGEFITEPKHRDVGKVVKEMAENFISPDSDEIPF